MIDAETSLAFSVYENKGIFALLIGSGVSRAAQIATGWEITLDLIRRVARLQGVDEQANWGKWYSEKFGKEPNYSELLDLLASTRDERRAILHRYIEPNEEDLAEGRKSPTKAHRAIAGLVEQGFVRVVITTNFDRLLENAVRDLGIEPTVIKSDDDLKGAVPLIHSRCFIIKLHGDYLDTRIRNTETELATYSNEMGALLDRIFDEHGLIVCGWSGEWDSALRNAIARAPNRRYPLFWAQRGTVNKTAEDLVQHRAGRFIEVADADSFFDALEQKVALQRELQRPNPRSIALLTASAKKYLTAPEYRIRLDDLIGQEVRNLSGLLAGDEFVASGAWSDAGFLRRIARYEAITEPLARIFGVLGRWGSEREFETAISVIKSLATLPAIGGLTVLIALRSYSAILLLYAYGLGAKSAGNLEPIRRLLEAPVDRSRGDTIPIVQHLFLDTWESGTPNLWNLLPEHGGENKKTPFSDHLHTLFRRFAEDYMLTPSDFSSSFEEFELLGSLAWLSLTATKASLTHALASQRDPFIWAPMGRVAWDSTTRDRLLGRWSTDPYRKMLLNAGYAQGDPEFFEQAKTSLRNVMSRLEW